MTKEEALFFWERACMSVNTYKASRLYGPVGIYTSYDLMLPEFSDAIATLITQSTDLEISDKSIKALYVNGERFDISVSEAVSAMGLWRSKGSAIGVLKYIESRL